jgi:hypothetical protein
MANLSDFYSSSFLAEHELQKQVNNSNYTFVLGDQKSELHVSTDASAYTWTIPLNADAAFPVGSIFTIYNEGAGDITLTADGAAIISEAGADGSDLDFVISQYALATVIKIDTDSWLFSSGSPSTSSAGPSTAKLIFIGSM